MSDTTPGRDAVVDAAQRVLDVWFDGSIKPGWVIARLSGPIYRLIDALTALADAPGGGARVTVTRDELWDAMSVAFNDTNPEWSNTSVWAVLGDSVAACCDLLRSKGIAVESGGAWKDVTED